MMRCMANDFEITEIGLVAEDVAAMVRFYDDLFGAGLEPFPMGGTNLYRGRLHGTSFYLCPNELAGVDAQQNRHQFTYSTTDLAATLELAVRAGGTVRDRTASNATVVDPDGNNIVFAQR